MLPGKKAIISGLIIFAIGTLIVNKVPAVRKFLGYAA